MENLPRMVSQPSLRFACSARREHFRTFRVARSLINLSIFSDLLHLISDSHQRSGRSPLDLSCVRSTGRSRNSLIAGRFGQYVIFCIWLFLLTPELRRLVEFYAGWEPADMLVLAPYAATGVSIVAIVIAVAGHPERAPGMTIVVDLPKL